jgi:predicted transcriptional regulator
MRKIITTKKGYTLILEKQKNDEIECVAYKTGIPMKSIDVAKHLKLSRSAVSQSLKRSIRKIYNKMRKENKILSSIEIMCIMADVFNVKSQIEYKKFFNLFPSHVKGEVYEEARETGYTH